jgi:hydrogenase maturation protease
MGNSQKSEEQANVQPAPLPILILGVGNTLLGDEGVGVHVINKMKEMEISPNIELVDGGTALVELLHLLSKREKVIVIDAVKNGNKPGTIYRFTPRDVSVLKQSQISVHQIGILEALRMADLAGWKPRDVVIFGIEPKLLDWSMELSPEVTNAIPGVIKLVIKELRQTEKL